MSTAPSQVTSINAARESSCGDYRLPELVGRVNRSLRHFVLRSMDLRFCTGCWSCCRKTLGRCIFRDDANTILPAILDSHIVARGIESVFGLPCATAKRLLGRTIPLVHPYIEIHHGESHHRKMARTLPQPGVVRLGGVGRSSTYSRHGCGGRCPRSRCRRGICRRRSPRPARNRRSGPKDCHGGDVSSRPDESVLESNAQEERRLRESLRCAVRSHSSRDSAASRAPARVERTVRRCELHSQRRSAARGKRSGRRKRWSFST